MSVGSLILCAALNAALQRFHKQPAVLGFTAPATHPHLYPGEAHDSEEEGSEGEQAKGGAAPDSQGSDGKPARSIDDIPSPATKPASPAVAAN